MAKNGCDYSCKPVAGQPNVSKGRLQDKDTAQSSDWETLRAY